MNRRHAILLFAVAPIAALAQTNQVLSIDDLVGMGRQFIDENVDEDALAQLGQLDQEKVRAVLKLLQDQLDQHSVLDLAALKRTAEEALKLLDSNTLTEDYAQWLRTRLDYFEVAGDLRVTLGPKPEAPAPVPTPAQVHDAWGRMLQQRARPTAATKYEARLKPIIVKNGAPRELFWLAEIESGFDPNARSPAGAVGMYQLTAPTAKSLGLSTWPFDERKNPEKSAAAAARYLHDLHQRFKDWPLAIAAYNAGSGRVRAGLERSKTKTFAAIASNLPSETQMYVPKLNAVLQLREGTTLERLGR
jgi:membrane-bound lytic murein transglycosylase D